VRRTRAFNALLLLNAALLCGGCVSVSGPNLFGFTGTGGNASADINRVSAIVSISAPTASLPNSHFSAFSSLGQNTAPPERPAAAAQRHRTPRAKPPPHDFLIKPVASGRLTSGHGYRINPVTGKPRRHNGIDYAATRGTKVFAAGAGIVEHMYRSRSYGNYIRIRHADGYATAYAHLNSFAKGIKAGVIVKQGQTIGTVGSTGKSTGPHLHFELIHEGRFVDPLSNRRQSDLADAGSYFYNLAKN